MKTAIAYLRVSTEAQAKDDRFGLKAQKTKILEYCGDNDVKVIDWYIDAGVSGSTKMSDRPAFSKILREGTPAQYVVVAKTDRISRDIMMYYVIKHTLQERGIEILSVQEDWSQSDKLTGMILENFLAMAAAVERENIKMRTSDGRIAKARVGGYSGGQAPFGYRAENGKLVVDEKEAEVVREIFALRSEGYSLRGIASILREEGVTGRSGEMSFNTVRHVVDNEMKYRGYYRYKGAGDWVLGKHEAILQPDVD